jgi:hypothetical protein
MAEDSSLVFIDETIAAMELALDGGTPRDELLRYMIAMLARHILGTAIRRQDVRELQSLFVKVAAGEDLSAARG